MGLIFSIEKDLGWMSWLTMECLYKTYACWLEIMASYCPQAAWGLYKKVNSLLNLDKNFTVHCGLAIGYENTKNKINTLKTERASLESFCKFI